MSRSYTFLWPGVMFGVMGALHRGGQPWETVAWHFQAAGLSHEAP